MNRPPKKNKATESSTNRNPRPVESDPLAPATQHGQPAPEQDDRNLVNIDQAFQEADVEDKVWLFWQRNKAVLIGGSILALIGVLAVQGYSFYQGQAEVALQNDYLEANKENTLETFGQANANKPLGAFALLESADKLYLNKEYSKAADLYGQAASGLTGTPFSGRAQLGEGIALIKDGKSEAGAAKLKLLTSDTSTLDSLRGEAAFNLALLALENGQVAEAKSMLDIIDTLPADSVWPQRAQALINNTPELDDLTAEQTSGESSIQVSAAKAIEEKSAEDAE